MARAGNRDRQPDMDEHPTDNGVFDQTPPTPERVGKPVGRPRGRASGETRERILDAAEMLFAKDGYDGTSIRDVAAKASVQIQAVGYHFGPKEDLFDAVVARRASVMTRLRETALADARAAADGAIPIGTLVRDYISPFIRSATHGDPGWRNYAALMGRLANSTYGTEVIARHYDGMARTYLDEFMRALPGTSEADVIDGFSAMVAAMLAICADTGRAERLSTTHATHRRPQDSLEALIRFHVAGFRALAV
jgi:AcrR family transcriptional regulator